MSERLTTSTRPLPSLTRISATCSGSRTSASGRCWTANWSDLGLSAQDYGILSVFETRPELSTSELARISQVTRQTMHTSILSLEAAGLVERSARNQRVVLVRPTTRGRQCLETATRRVRLVEHAALADLSRKDARTIRAWLASLAALTTGPEKAEAEQKEKS